MIDVEPGDTTGTRHALAFDLGTTTVVATLLDLESGQPLAVQSLLNAQQPFGGDVISRISATMMDPDALDTLRSRAHETMAALAIEVCEEAGIAPEQVYEITVCGNATMMHLALGIDPEPLSMAPFTVTTHELPRDAGRRLRRRRAPARAGLRLPLAGRLRRRRHRGRHARHRAHARPPHPALHRRRHQQRDRAGLRGAACSPPRRPRGPPSRRRRSAAACAPPRARSRASASPTTTLRCRSSATPSRSACAARASSTAWPSSCARGCSTTRGASSPTRTRPPLSPALAPRLTKIGEERVFVMHWRGEDPAESIFLSQRDVRELQFAKASIATGWKILLRRVRHRGRRHPAGAPGRQLRRLPLPRQRGAHRPRAASWPCRASSRPATWPARGRRSSPSATASAPRRARSCARCEYVELSGRADFNDLFVDELAFPG